MWTPLMTMASLVAMVTNGIGPDDPPLVCVEDGVIKFGGHCDAIRMVVECVEAVIGTHQAETGADPVETPLVEIRTPEPPSVSTCAGMLP